MADLFFQQLVIENIANNSGMFTGENRMRAFYNQQKRNDGFGRNVGVHNRILWNQQLVIDADTVDVTAKNTNKRNESG